MTFNFRSVPALLLLIGAIPAIGYGQDDEALRHLLFDPVLIEAEYVADELRISELTSLPASEQARPIAAIIQEQAGQEPAAQGESASSSQSISQYEQAINDLRLTGGAYEPGLPEELMALSNLHQAQGEHDKALELLDQALHINRIHDGLYNLGQEVIVQEKIESLLALGDLREADLQQEYMFYLRRKAHGPSSIELLPALTRYAEWNIYAFNARFRANPPRTGDAGEARDRESADSRVAASTGREIFGVSRLVNAQNVYSAMIHIILSNYGLTDPRLPDMERRLALTNYFLAANYGSGVGGSNGGSAFNLVGQGMYGSAGISSTSSAYRHGRDALERRIHYLRNMENLEAQEVARAQIDLGDWLLAFNKRMSALNVYTEAYQELQQQGAPQPLADAIFSPALPQKVPPFIHYRHTRRSYNIPDDEAIAYQGHIDVEFTLNRYGSPRDIEILGKTGSAAEAIEASLLRHIRSGTFRPRFREGQLLEKDLIQARYYFAW